MQSIHFRPKLEAIEDRVTPSITPADVFGAAAQTESARQTLWGLYQHLDEPMNVYEKPFWASYLPTVVQESRDSHDVLAEFANSLPGQIATDSTAAALAPPVAKIQALQSQAALNALYAGAFAIQFGVPAETVFPTSTSTSPPPPTSPPTPPPAPFPDTPPTQPNPSDDSGMTDTLPPLNAAEWQTTASGLKIWDVTEGTGAQAQAGGNVTAHYTGWLTDGTVFDSSRASLATRPGVTGDPIEFSLNGVIEGWQEGIPGMKVGGIRRLYIPADLAYGAQGSGSVPPNSDLIFEVKLAEVG